MRQKLEETLNDLHEQLVDVENLDDEQKAMLRQALEEIKSTLDQDDVNSASLAERLQESTEQFKHTHPTLTNTVGRIADLLSQMGI